VPSSSQTLTGIFSSIGVLGVSSTATPEYYVVVTLGPTDEPLSRSRRKDLLVDGVVDGAGGALCVGRADEGARLGLLGGIQQQFGHNSPHAGDQGGRNGHGGYAVDGVLAGGEDSPADDLDERGSACRRRLGVGVAPR